MRTLKWYQWLNLIWLTPLLLIMIILGVILWLITRPLPQKYRHKVASYVRFD